jgi:hypothetical protein
VDQHRLLVILDFQVVVVLVVVDERHLEAVGGLEDARWTAIERDLVQLSRQLK